MDEAPKKQIPKLLLLKKKVPSTDPIISNVAHGSIRVGQQRMRKSYPSFPGFMQIPAWSRGKGIYKELSPFFLGPVTATDGLVANNLENYWQHQKIYPVHLDKDGNPSKEWYLWREKGFNMPPDRHPMGKAKPAYLYHNGQKLDVVNARLQVYIPIYKELARKTKSYAHLLSLLKNGTNILLIEPDGPPLDRFPSGLQVDINLLDDLKHITNLNGLYNRLGLLPSNEDKYFPYGHGYVLAEALLEDLAK